MLKKLTATGILAGAAMGAVLLGGPAHANSVAAGPSAVSRITPACYDTTPGYVRPAWCPNYLPNQYYNHGWKRRHHHGWDRNPHHWHR